MAYIGEFTYEPARFLATSVARNFNAEKTKIIFLIKNLIIFAPSKAVP
jgi:hypothetical protein